MIQIAVLGYGTVGNGVVSIIDQNHETVNKKATEEINVKYILDLRDFPGDPNESKVVHDFDVIVNDPEIKIICETMGGTGAAYKFTKAALEKGISVCTSNKEMVAKHAPELLKIAKDNNCNYLFEASVGGGIPIIRPLNYSLTAEKIEEISGILNGTTNFILTKMQKEGADYAEVLREAQELGYAEKDPTNDVEGYDACRKIAILSSLMYGKNVDYTQIFTEGITKISADDFFYTNKMGSSIKILATCKSMEDGAQAMVSPFVVPGDHPLSVVNYVFNAIFVSGNMLGPSMYYGQGAGSLPTASAVVSDVIDCARHIGKVITCFWTDENVKVLSVEESKFAYFVRVKKDALDEVKASLGAKEVMCFDEREDAAIITDVMKEADFNAKKDALADKILSRIRMY